MSKFWEDGCPSCGARGYQVTLMCHVSGQDRNRWTCVGNGHYREHGCGASGIVCEYPKFDMKEKKDV